MSAPVPAQGWESNLRVVAGSACLFHLDSLFRPPTVEAHLAPVTVPGSFLESPVRGLIGREDLFGPVADAVEVFPVEGDPLGV
ncbi:MAG: hypothetical protein MI923_10725, partial [Phycisphaerales bacterium]|nr:hypothetical protein [Phycisphaerales bacterium]